MFTGLVQAVVEVQDVLKKSGLLTYSVLLPNPLGKGLQRGASISVNGVCQSVVRMKKSKAGVIVVFDAIGETLERTTLRDLQPEQRVHVERALRVGDEIGGHLLSGHVMARAQIQSVNTKGGRYALRVKCHPTWSKYLFEKGFVALDGVSLTLGKVSAQEFTVYLIPTTLAETTLGDKKSGDWVNIEIDTQTQAIVDTVERLQLRTQS